MSAASRHKAWKTRRQKYGPNGHKGSYACWRTYGGMKDRFLSMQNWLVRLHVEGVLSEGQLSKALMTDRVTCRILRDEYNNPRKE